MSACSTHAFATAYSPHGSMARHVFHTLTIMMMVPGTAATDMQNKRNKSTFDYTTTLQRFDRII
jgi:hypothetical protein